MSRLASTGIPSLDRLVGNDGYPSRSTVLIVGPPGVGKEVLGYSFVVSGLEKREFCLYITKRSVREVIENAKAFGVESELKDPFWIATDGGHLKFDIGDLTALSFKIKETLKERGDKRIRIVIDALSSLLVLNPPESIYRFLNQLFEEIKKYDTVLLATLEDGMHSPQVFAAMQELFDGVVELRLYEKRLKFFPLLRIVKMRGIAPRQQYYNFTYSTTTGLEVT